MKDGDPKRKGWAAVSKTTNQAPQSQELRERFGWSASDVWTERMLTALGNGVKGGKNTFFAERGLFTCTQAYALARQSRCGNT